ncbi:tetratricopeptide repeat protein [Luteimonas sp. Y-2-2-4F]|nr:tetratricopeptide repeat protein [Luteimonas sp. Y-2-2-4F]MCD9031705.1 tetratricopeptide repeat protein [Luteimonas sp. Y-2-2-4F]
MPAPARPQPLTASQAARFSRTLARLRNGEPLQAEHEARRLLQEAPEAADAWQLLGMCLADAGRLPEALAAFEQALQRAPGSVPVLSNAAACLRRAGRLEEAYALLGRAAGSAEAALQQGRLALQLRDPARAVEACRRALALAPDSAAAWLGLGRALRARGDWDAAAQALEEAVRRAPAHAPAWAALGAVHRLTGRVDEALRCLRRAEALGDDGPELLDALSGTLVDAGEPQAALDNARRLVARHPAHAGGHDTLARLLWEHGDEDPLAGFRAAARAQPGNRPLWQAFARLLLSARRPEDALDATDALRQRHGDDPTLRWLRAEALDRLGRMEEAAAAFSAAHRALGGDNVAFLNAHARHLFRRGDWRRARDHAEAATRLAPDDQEAWSHLGTAWRLAGDAREFWLCDYERLVGDVEIRPPPGYRDLAAFLVALADRLEALHRAVREPVDQSVRNGSQTPGRLFGRGDPVLDAAQAALQGAVRGWLDALPHDDRHPFLGRRRRDVRMLGSWSVRLRASGRHANHIHPQGWLSSAFYVALPDDVRRDGAHPAGCLQLGQPLEDLGLALPPRRIVRPAPGRLALFPSYVWHGTVPFSSPVPRLTIAVDMLPAP